MPPMKAVVVTGASSGIGEACALRLDAAGYRVFAGVRRAVDGEALRSKASGSLTPVLLDVTDGAAIAGVVGQITATVGRKGIAGLVNNAGITAPGPLEALPVSHLRTVLEVNVIGLVAVTQAFLPLLRLGRGRVIVMGSLSGRIATPLTGAYNASKFAIEALSDVLRMELRLQGIEVSVIEPGAVATPIWNKALASNDAVVSTTTPETRALYGALIDGMRAWAVRSSAGGIPLDEVTDAVMHALTAVRPKTRYAVGKGSRLFLLLRYLPDRRRDNLLLRAFGL